MTDCLFCKIVRGELPSYTVYENERTLAFLDIHPTNPGHTLVIPKQHTKNIFEISQGDWAALSETVRMLAGKIESAVGADGINIMMNNREHGGQIIHHAHVHIIPRFKNDGLKAWSHTDYQEGGAESVLDQIRAIIKG